MLPQVSHSHGSTTTLTRLPKMMSRRPAIVSVPYGACARASHTE